MESSPNREDKANPEQNAPERLSFINELKRRKVFRVAITYAVVSWLIIQIASATFSDFGIPDWAFRFVVLMVLLGFPVAVLLTWAFELTPDGVRKTSAVSALADADDPTNLNRRRNGYAIGMAAALPTLIFGTLAAVFYFGQSPNSNDPSAGIQRADERPYVIGSVAMLPFTIIADEPGIKTTAEGLQEEVLTTLSEMGPLDVISRTSTLRFGEEKPSIPEMGEALGADFIVEGSIQSVGSKIRVTLQLIQAAEDNHIWAETFDRGPERMEDLLMFQKELAFELALRIYQALKEAYPPTGIGKEQRSQMLQQMEESLTASYNAFWPDYKAGDWATRYELIVKQIQRILEIDPDNAVAYEAYAGIVSAAPDAGIESAFDPDYRKAYYLILKRAYAVVPDGFDTNKHLGMYYYIHENKPHRAIPYSRKAVRLEEEIRGTVDIYTYWILLESLCATGQSAAALRIVEDATNEDLASFSGPAWFWTRSYQVIGRHEDRIAILEKQIQKAITEETIEAEIQYGLDKAMAQSRWAGTLQPLVEYGEQLKKRENVPWSYLRWIRGTLAFQSGDYETLLGLISEVNTGTSWHSFMSVDIAGARAWAYLNTNNLALAKSYFKSYLNELETSPKGKWMKVYQPDVYAALQSFGNACLGNRKDALEWTETALAHADPSRHFEDYFRTIGQLAVTYTILGDDDRACELIDQILSSPCGISTGEILIDPQLKGLLGSPAFEAVIRKHADQLKDPAILEQHFGI